MYMYLSMSRTLLGVELSVFQQRSHTCSTSFLAHWEGFGRTN